MLAQIDSSWQQVLAPHSAKIAEINRLISTQNIAPKFSEVYRVFTKPLSHYRAVILGQDPYPTPGYANGFAFSVNSEVKQLPASLRNIFEEYCADTGYPKPASGNLDNWVEQGVALLNTSLSLNLDEKSAHLKIGWQEITKTALEALSKQKVVAILWGSHAQRAGAIFPDAHKVISVHPSPLSAYRGFFGSRPFSRCNELLQKSGQETINWRLP